ncbi:FAD-dependent oxidoreductase [Phycisphaeraceae bacterium D3-23]
MNALTRSLSRRQFIGHAGGVGLLALLGLPDRQSAYGQPDSEFVFLEAEGFDDHGGWDLDQQSMDQMGSPYLLAHGLGVPVDDARTSVAFPSAGTYRVWVRTRDWVAPWEAPGAPGRFQLLVDGEPLETTFGIEGADWHWQDGGTVAVDGETAVALHDLTGFEGRCEAVLFCKDTAFEPTNELDALMRFRRALLGLPEEPDDGGSFDLVVVGGGIAGTCAALSAARQGLRVALVQDRAVLGGNGSSEVRVWPEGRVQVAPFEHVGDIVQEILPTSPAGHQGTRNGQLAHFYDDDRKLAIVRDEPRITLLNQQRAVRVETEGDTIRAVIIQSTRTGRWTRVAGEFFSDCTGDAVIGHLAGADYEFAPTGNMGNSNLWSVLDADDEQEVLQCECKDKDALSAAFEAGDTEQPFPRCPWAIDLSDKPFPGRANYRGQWGGGDPLSNLGGWFWESGFDKNPIEDIERIRDLNFRAMYGAWDTLKNVDGQYPNHRLGWAAFIAGKRESRRLMGDVVLGAEDFLDGRDYEDKAFPCSWHIDLHVAHPQFDDDLEGEEFISQATTGEGFTYQGPYWAPYRTLYSRNIGNLFMAGRDISVSKEGLGPVRVMRTCGAMGEVVGKAAAICVKQQTTPRGVYAEYLVHLHELMGQPGATRVE